MTFFQHLPSSVLQANSFSRLLSKAYRCPNLNHLRLPWSSISFLEDHHFTWCSRWFILDLYYLCCGRCRLFQYDQLLKSLSYTAVPLLVTAPVINHRSLCDLLSLWEFCQDGPLPGPWFPTGRSGARDLSWIYSNRFDPKEHRKGLYMNMILRQAKVRNSSES